MQRIFVAFAWVVLARGGSEAWAQSPKPEVPKPAAPGVAPAGLATEDEKTLYALGLNVAQSLSNFALKPAELEIVKRGVTDGVLGTKPAIDVQAYRAKLDALARARTASRAEGEKARSQSFVDQASKETGAVKTASGLVYRETLHGTGATPKPSDTVKVHYRGTLIDGTEFDSSIKRGQPAEFPLGGVIPCWTEGLQKLNVGGKAKLVCPSSIAYGDGGRPPIIPPGATLVFEVELLDIKK